MNQTPEHEQAVGQTSSPAGSGAEQAPGAQPVSEQAQSGEALAPGEDEFDWGAALWRASGRRAAGRGEVGGPAVPGPRRPCHAPLWPPAKRLRSAPPLAAPLPGAPVAIMSAPLGSGFGGGPGPTTTGATA